MTVDATQLKTKAEASEFFVRAGFGGSLDQITAAVGEDAADLLKAEFEKPRRAYLPRTRTLFNSYADGNGRANRSHANIFWKDMVEADDALRHRMVFALSQILVTSDLPMGDRPFQNAYYLDVLGQHAFGNYRDLLEDVTYSPAMGEYLTYRGNRKGDPNTGRTPDENYARELLQLFTIGLVELNMDGTPKTGADGEPIEIYDNDDILGLARVFTGLDLESKSTPGYERLHPRRNKPMAIFADRHSPLEKSFLGTTIPAGTGAAASIDQALDAIFAHPNVAPFISRQLIQRFTASHPEPAYVQRVAEAFEAGSFRAPNGTEFGTGDRGDLEATLAAILLDESQLIDDDVIRTTTDLGKVREPVLDFVHWARAFEVSPATPENQWDLLYDARNGADKIGQMPLSSPSVFNFYRPGYIAGGTESGDQSLTVPEFQLLLQGNRAGYANMLTEFAFDRTYGPDNETASFTPDYSGLLPLVETPEELADYLDTLLMGGRMEATTRQAIVDGVGAIEIRTNTSDNEAKDRFHRAAYGVTVAVTSPEFMIR